MTKPKRDPARRGPKPHFNGNAVTSIKLGDRDRALIALYSRRHLGTGDEKPNVNGILRWALEVLCMDFTDEEIETEKSL